MSDNAPITQRLRDFVKIPWTTLSSDVVLNYCDNIDALHKSLEDKFIVLRDFCEHVKQIAHARKDVTLWGTDYMALPLDADGVPIHVGDMMHGTCPSDKYVCGEVSAIGNNKFWLCNVQFSLCPDYMRHYYKPTVADVLQEFYVLAVRGKEAHAEDVDEDVLAEYAAKLRLAGDADE